MNGQVRKIIHVDMDCFYAAVEVKHRPDLRGKPLAVGGPPNTRSVLTTASYEARKFGVRSAMPSSQAVRLCPQLILVPPNFDLYREESLAIREILRRFTSKIEPLSLDEAYLDVTDCPHFDGSATRLAQEIRRLIQEERGLTASAGIAPNKFLAKIASDWRKPNGQFVIRPQDVEGFVRELPVEKIHGVGKVTAKKLHERGLRTCGDIRRHDIYELARWFGSRAADLHDYAHGIDHRPVDTSTERKSLTVEETYDKDLTTLEEGLSRLPGLYSDWEERMHRKDERERIRGFVVKVKYFDFKSTTHQTASTEWPTLEDFRELFLHVWENRPEPIRLIGLGVRLGADSVAADSSQLSFAI